MSRAIYPNIESINGIKYNEIFMVLGGSSGKRIRIH